MKVIDRYVFKLDADLCAANEGLYNVYVVGKNFALAGVVAAIAGCISPEHSAEVGLWVAGGVSYVAGALAVGHTVGDLQPKRPQS